MRTLPMIAALVLGATLAMPAQAEFGFSVQIGGGQISRGHAGAGHTGRGAHAATTQRNGAFCGERRVKRRPAPRRHRGLFPFSRDYYRDYGRRDRAPAPVRPDPVPVPPEAVAPVEPPPPPDPHGPLRRTLARGVLPGPALYSLGEALAPNLPHVTLDWRKFDLPEPPAGRLYARVGRDVLLITAAGRVVERVLPPG